MIRNHVPISVIPGTERSEYEPGLRHLHSCGITSEIVPGPITPEYIHPNTLAVVDYRLPHPIPHLRRDGSVAYVLDISSIFLLGAPSVANDSSTQCFDKIRQGVEVVARASDWPFEFAQLIAMADHELDAFEGRRSVIEKLDRKFAKNNALYLHVLDGFTRSLKGVCEIARNKPELIAQLDGSKRHCLELGLQTCREALSAANELRYRSA
jgi:hypothetical protein